MNKYSKKIQKYIVTKLYNWISNIHIKTKKASEDLRQYRYYLDFEERDSDIYVTTYLKSGTTWTQVILYNLLFEVDLNFEHIYDVSPWTNNEAYLNHTPDRVNKLPSPRIIKTHDKYDFFSKDVKGKFIFVFRDGRDIAASLYHHIKNYKNPDLTFEQNFETHFVNPKTDMNWFSYTQEWLKNKDQLNILYISFNDLKNNFEQTLKRIAAFIEVEVSDEKIQRIKENTSFQRMKENEHKFGEPTPISARLVFDQFIRKGEIGDGAKYMDERQHSYFEAQYNHMIKPLESVLQAKAPIKKK